MGLRCVCCKQLLKLNFARTSAGGIVVLPLTTETVMSTRQYGCPSFDSLKTAPLKLLQDKGYGNDTINNYRRKLNQLERHMMAHDIVTYDPSVGQRFIDDYLSMHALSQGNRDYCVGHQYQIQRKTDSSRCLKATRH